MSRGWFYVHFMVFFVALVYLVEWFLGQVYARYVLAYTGTVFMAGMLLGQRSERVWDHQQELIEKRSHGARYLKPGGSENPQGGKRL